MVTKKSKKNRPRIKLSKPAELLAAVPHILGFRPVSSVVLLQNTERGKEIGRRLRGDLPPPEATEPAAKQLAESIAIDDPSSVLILIVGDGKDEGDHPPPHAELVEALRRELDARGVAVPAAYWVPAIAKGARWRCYDHVECTGVLPDPMSSVVAAEVASRGHVTYGSREELERLLAPDSDVLLRRRAEAIDEKLRRLAGGDARELSPEYGADVLRTALRAAGTGLLTLSDERIAELGLALTDKSVRDACLATAVPADSELAQAAMHLWQALTRSLPAPERAEAACLAGYAAYMRGDGALAGIAFQIALEADSAHVLAGLLARALGHGLHPERLHGLAGHDEIGLCAGVRAAA